MLAALIVAMTIGAFTLHFLETTPSPLSATDLMALDQRADYLTDVPFKNKTWHNIVVHSSAAERPDITSRVHFIVDTDGAQLIRPTELWKKQAAANHVASPIRNYNADSIGICIKGDFSRNPPTAQQFAALVELTTTLQQMCNISVQNVYLNSDINNTLQSPGRAFPARNFSNSLLRAK